MASYSAVYNDTHEDAYIDIYRVRKYNNGPPSTFPNSLTWDALLLAIESLPDSQFRACNRGDTVKGPSGTLSWHMEFGGYLVKERDAYGRPIKVEIFEGKCWNGAGHNATKTHTLSSHKRTTGMVQLNPGAVGTKELKNRFAPGVPDFDTQDIATTIQQAVLAISAIGAAAASVWKAFAPAPPATEAPLQAAGVSTEYEVTEIDDSSEVVVYEAPPPNRRFQRNQTGNETEGYGAPHRRAIDS
jgi:hypothetical protein